MTLAYKKSIETNGIWKVKGYIFMNLYFLPQGDAVELLLALCP